VCIDGAKARKRDESIMRGEVFIPAQVRSYGGIAAARPDMVRLVSDTWRSILRHGEPLKGAASPAGNQYADEATLPRRLRHPLSPRALVRAGARLSPEQRAHSNAQITQRNAIEIAALGKFQNELSISLDDEDADRFNAALENNATELHATKTCFRKISATIVADAHGVGWQCVSPAEALPRLGELRRHIINAPQSPLQTAVVALVMTSRIPPFMDCNGRRSRILFHAMLRKHDMSNELYVPLKNFYALSDFGFVIRLRHRFLTGNLAEVAVYFCHVLQLWQKRAGLLTASAASL
jgi:hypothetical protein